MNRTISAVDAAVLHRRGVLLERITLGWNIVGVIVLAIAASSASSVALAGFGLDSLIEIGASGVVLWELAGTDDARRRAALRFIGVTFVVLAVYLVAQSAVALATQHHARHSPAGVAWTAVTAGAMFVLATGKSRTGRALDDPVLTTEGRVTMIDGILATAVLAGITLNAAFGWWWADPAAGLVIACYAAREAHHIFTGHDAA
ncbi:MAG: cation efflux protein [Ilumatobacteraceae bacterium]|nr:cation efflux protein [Ilumatobacteraceae bacterium]